MDQKIVVSKKREFGDVLNAGFAFVKQEYKNVGKMVVMYAGIPVLLYAALSAFFVRDQFNSLFKLFSDPSRMQDFSQSFSPALYLVYLLSLVMMLFLYGLSYGYVILYHKNNNQTPLIADVWNLFVKKFSALIGYSILTILIFGVSSFVVTLLFGITQSAIMIVLAVLCIFIAMIYLSVNFAFIFIIKMNEDVDYFQALRRAFSLVKGNWWTSFGLGFVTFLITGVISSIITFPVTGYTLIHEYLAPAATRNFAILPAILMAIFSTISVLITYPLNALIMSFQYFSLVEKKDNNVLMEKIDSINIQVDPDND